MAADFMDIVAWTTKNYSSSLRTMLCQPLQ